MWGIMCLKAVPSFHVDSSVFILVNKLWKTGSYGTLLCVLAPCCVFTGHSKELFLSSFGSGTGTFLFIQTFENSSLLSLQCLNTLDAFYTIMATWWQKCARPKNSTFFFWFFHKVPSRWWKHTKHSIISRTLSPQMSVYTYVNDFIIYKEIMHNSVFSVVHS